MNSTQLVPEPPEEEVVIPAEDEARLKKWTDFFRGLSTRVKIILPKDDEFKGFLTKMNKVLREAKKISNEYEILDFPLEKNIAFVILVNESEPGSIFEVYDWSDAFFFCFDNVAFSLNHFQWDGDLEEDDWASSFSLKHYSKDLLYWDFIKKLIVGRLRDLEKRVPPFEQ